MNLPVDLSLQNLGLNEWLMISGVMLLLLGFVIMWRTSRYSLTEAAAESAWQVATGGRNAENPTAIEQKITNITSQETVSGKAKAAAGTVIGHFYAQVMGLISTIMMVVGVVLAGAGYWWR